VGQGISGGRRTAPCHLVGLAQLLGALLLLGRAVREHDEIDFPPVGAAHPHDRGRVAVAPAAGALVGRVQPVPPAEDVDPVGGLCPSGEGRGGERSTAPIVVRPLGSLAGASLPIGGDAGDHPLLERDLLHPARHVPQVDQQAVGLGHPHGAVGRGARAPAGPTGGR
jgi:hypothetical protein